MELKDEAYVKRKVGDKRCGMNVNAAPRRSTGRTQTFKLSLVINAPSQLPVTGIKHPPRSKTKGGSDPP